MVNVTLVHKPLQRDPHSSAGVNNQLNDKTAFAPPTYVGIHLLTMRGW